MSMDLSDHYVSKENVSPLLRFKWRGFVASFLKSQAVSTPHVVTNRDWNSNIKYDLMHCLLEIPENVR